MGERRKKKERIEIYCWFQQLTILTCILTMDKISKFYSWKKTIPANVQFYFLVLVFCVVKVEINLGQLFDEKWMGKWTRTLILKKFLINKQVLINYLIFTNKNVEREKYFQIFFFNNFLPTIHKIGIFVRIFVYAKEFLLSLFFFLLFIL